MKRITSIFVTLILLSACSPAIGTKAWCESLEEKPKGDWTANEAKDYTKHCIFKHRNTANF